MEEAVACKSESLRYSKNSNRFATPARPRKSSKRHLIGQHVFKTVLVRGFLRSSLGGMERIKGERNEQQTDRTENHNQNGVYLGRFVVEKWDFRSKCFVSIFRIVLSYPSGEHNFRKPWKVARKWKRSQNNVGYIKISSKRCRIHQDLINIMLDTSLKSPKEATCSNNTHIC